MKIASTNQMQFWERQAVQSGTSVADLMRAAVNGCLEIIQEHIRTPRPVYIFCGKGNNGNDGIVLGCELEKRGWPVNIILTHEPSQRTQPPFDHLDEFLQRAYIWPKMPEKSGKPKLVIDALLGLGVKGAPRDATREILTLCRNGKKNRDVYLSIDPPSGLDPDTGDPDELTFPADITCAIGAVKQGCLRDTAQPFVGKIISVPIPLKDASSTTTEGEFLTQEDAAGIIQPIPSAAHKHSRGRISIWGGPMPGATILAARAALRTGAGLVKLYLRSELFSAAVAQTPEIIPRPIGEEDHLPEEFFDAHAHVIGPGMGRHPKMREKFFEMLPCLESPVVLDADALYFLGDDPDQLRRIDVPFILTPHVKEMERLTAEPVTDRAHAASAWVKERGGTLVLKGPHTVVATTNQPLSHNSTGNPGLATAGTGDVLAGILAGLLAQGYPAWDAARLGSFLHGLAADLAAAQSSPQSLIASDVTEHLGKAWQRLIEC